MNPARADVVRREPGWGAALALAGAIFAGLLALAGRTTLWDRDEPRFAQATVEMIASGDYLVPTFNGKLRPDKPALVYWLMSLPVRLLGPTAVAARLWSAAAMAAAALLTFATARRLLPARAGLWAMAVMATTPLAIVEGQAATTDAVLLAAVTAAMACFAAVLIPGAGRMATLAERRIGGHGSPWPWLGLGVALGLAQLAKGPVGLAVPALAIAATLVISRRRQRAGTGADAGGAAAEAMKAGAGVTAAAVPMPVKPGAMPPLAALARRAALAALLGVGIFCAWGVPANLATGGELARLGIGKHVVGRALGAMEGHGGAGWRGWAAGLPFYLVVTWIGFAPWVLWLPAAISAALGGRLGGERGRALLIGWSVPTLALMTLVATRLPHYVLPAWPALALAVGGTLEAERRGELAPRDRLWLRRGAWLLGPLVALAAAAVAVAGARQALALIGGPPLLPGPAHHAVLVAPASLPLGLVAACLALGVVVVVAGGWALRAHRAGRYQLAALALLAGAVAAAGVAGGALAPELERLKPAPRLAAAVRAATAPGVPVATFEYGEPTFIFYLGRWPVRELRDAGAVAAWAAERAPGVLVLPRSAWQPLRAAPWAARLTEIATASGWNVSKGSRLELVALRRAG